MIVCAGVTPGEIGCHVANPSFVLSESHTVAELSGGTVTFALTTCAAASLSTGSSISLFRPLELFDFAIVAAVFASLLARIIRFSRHLTVNSISPFRTTILLPAPASLLLFLV